MATEPPRLTLVADNPGLYVSLDGLLSIEQAASCFEQVLSDPTAELPPCFCSHATKDRMPVELQHSTLVEMRRLWHQGWRRDAIERRLNRNGRAICTRRQVESAIRHFTGSCEKCVDRHRAGDCPYCEPGCFVPRWRLEGPLPSSWSRRRPPAPLNPLITGSVRSVS